MFNFSNAYTPWYVNWNFGVSFLTIQLKYVIYLLLQGVLLSFVNKENLTKTIFNTNRTSFQKLAYFNEGFLSSIIVIFYINFCQFKFLNYLSFRHDIFRTCKISSSSLFINVKKINLSCASSKSILKGQSFTLVIILLPPCLLEILWMQQTFKIVQKCDLNTYHGYCKFDNSRSCLLKLWLLWQKCHPIFPKARPFRNNSKKNSGQNMLAFQRYFGARNWPMVHYKK
jgi:hypothetical protein